MSHNSLPRTLARILRMSFIAALWLLPSPAGAYPAGEGSGVGFTVDSDTDAVDANPGDGLCATAVGECTLRAAVQETNALPGADTIILPAGTYTLTIAGADEDAAATGDLDITDDLTIAGIGLEETDINGNGNMTGDRVFHIPGAAAVTMSGVTIRRGIAGNGGGIINGGSLTLLGILLHNNAAGHSGGGLANTGTLVVSQSRISNNKVRGEQGEGAGIWNSGTIEIIQSTLTDNSATGTYGHGGGVFNAPGGTTTISHSRLTNNLAARIYGAGGGIYNTGALMISHSTISSHPANFRSSYYGGGIYNNGRGGEATLTLRYSTILDTRAKYSGAGIYNDGYDGEATVTVSHSTISGTTASNYGGGISNNYGTLIVSHSTITGNSGGFTGGGIYNCCVGLSSVILQSTILAGNSAAMDGPDCFNGVDSIGYNLVGNSVDCDFNAAAGDLVGTPADPIDPLLGPLQDNGGPTFTHALLEGSPAIDAGNPDECPPTDQRGYPRPVDGDGNGSAICDIGSYEFGSAPP